MRLAGLMPRALQERVDDTTSSDNIILLLNIFFLLLFVNIGPHDVIAGVLHDSVSQRSILFFNFFFLPFASVYIYIYTPTSRCDLYYYYNVYGGNNRRFNADDSTT